VTATAAVQLFELVGVVGWLNRRRKAAVPLCYGSVSAFRPFPSSVWQTATPQLNINSLLRVRLDTVKAILSASTCLLRAFKSGFAVDTWPFGRLIECSCWFYMNAAAGGAIILMG